MGSFQVIQSCLLLLTSCATSPSAGLLTAGAATSGCAPGTSCAGKRRCTSCCFSGDKLLKYSKLQLTAAVDACSQDLETPRAILAASAGTKDQLREALPLNFSFVNNLICRKGIASVGRPTKPRVPGANLFWGI